MVVRFTARRAAAPELVPAQDDPSPALEGVSWTVFPEPGPEPVVPDDPVGTGEALEEGARRRVLPVLLEVRHPATAEEQQRSLADARVRDPAPVELREAEILFHHPRA